MYDIRTSLEAEGDNARVAASPREAYSITYAQQSMTPCRNSTAIMRAPVLVRASWRFLQLRAVPRHRLHFAVGSASLTASTTESIEANVVLRAPAILLITDCRRWRHENGLNKSVGCLTVDNYSELDCEGQG